MLLNLISHANGVVRSGLLKRTAV